MSVSKLSDLGMVVRYVSCVCVIVAEQATYILGHRELCALFARFCVLLLPI